MILVGALMILPLTMCIIYKEVFRNYLSFLVPIISLIGIGLLMNFKKASPKIQAREGFVIVASSWLIMSLVGALPLIISGYYPNFFDAFFEISSGFSTTGASVTSAELMESMLESGHSILFWRSFSHWIGGMGVLVFILTIIPESDEGSSVHILRAESPGPQVGRLVSKMKASTRILYLIYIGLSLIETILLWVGPNSEMNLFASLVYTFGTAGTGGFAISPISVEAYSAYYQYVIGVFMIVFGTNFTLFYLMLIGKFKDIFKNEEFRWYIATIIVAIVIVMISIRNIATSFEENFRLSFFQVSSIISTTGFSTTNFDLWPGAAHVVLIILMVFGSCGGSTGGAIKISRVVIIIKSSFSRIRNMTSPRKVSTVKFNGEAISKETINGVHTFVILYAIIIILSALLISFDGADITTNFTASLACISNIGPGLGKVGPYGSYAFFSNFSKFVLSIEMIAGRLELFPILILFNPKTWSKMQ